MHLLVHHGAAGRGRLLLASVPFTKVAKLWAPSEQTGSIIQLLWTATAAVETARLSVSELIVPISGQPTLPPFLACLNGV